jgi:hypothetical protein
MNKKNQERMREVEYHPNFSESHTKKLNSTQMELDVTLNFK